jgi:hypothetical protein
MLNWVYDTWHFQAKGHTLGEVTELFYKKMAAIS